MGKILALVLCFILSIVCYRQAVLRGRNPYIWFVIGILFGIFGLITLLLLPPLYNGKKLKKISPPPTTPPIKSILEPQGELHHSRLWYYLDTDRRQYGPMSLDALSQAWALGKVSASTYVWHEAMENWVFLQEVLKPTVLR